MADKHSKETRSYNMSRIRSKDTKPEEIVRKYLFSKGFRYRKNDSRLPGKPDVVLPKYRTVVFINGCFWHAHEGCRYFVWPQSNTAFWKAKITGTIQRDKQCHQMLTENGWKVLVVWECELKKTNRESTLCQLEKQIKGLVDENSPL